MPKPKGDQQPEFFCGCCGRQMKRNTDWCPDCVKHILPKYKSSGQFTPPSERTYFAQHSQDCPFQERENDA